MNAEVKERLENYTPQIDADQWQRIRPVVLALVTRAQPHSLRSVHAIGAAVVKYVCWAEDKKLPLKEVDLVDKSVREWFLEDSAFSSRATEDTYASALKRMALGGSARKTARSIRHPVSDPYTLAEQEALLALAGCQPTEAFSLRIEAMIRIGLGAGAQPAEQRFVKPDDVFEKHGRVHVRLGVAGSETREVGVIAVHGARLVELAQKARELNLPYLVTGEGSPNTRNCLSGINARINGSDLAPTLSAWTLRTTWLVAHLEAGTRLDVLLAAAGKGAVARLAELLKHISVFDEKQAAEIMALDAKGQK